MPQFITGIDTSILLWIQDNLRAGWLNPVMILITTLGNAGLIWIVISLGFSVPKKTRKLGLTCFVSLLLTLLFAILLLKNLVQRPRPFTVIDTLVPLVSLPKDWSFPSGHTASSFACAWILFRKLPKRYGVPFLILAILIGFSRLYVGVHFPSDVLTGMILGIAFSYLADFIMKKLSPE